MDSPLKNSKAALFIIFSTVFIDLIGFGMVIPLIGLYGKHFGGRGFELSLLGGIYSLMQFFFAPVWGQLSDRWGRRPILLISMLGSTLSYLIFGLAQSYIWILISRAFGGIFAANISAAQAYIADITSPEERARGMGLLGAAFGIGFTLGPPLGGFAAQQFGLAAPGLIAAVICGVNLVFAIFRLPESLPTRERGNKSGQKNKKTYFSLALCLQLVKNRELAFLVLTFFSVTFAFSTMEQAMPLLFQTKFQLETASAGLKTGVILMFAGIIGAFVQGVFIRRWVPRFGEARLLLCGLFLHVISIGFFPYGPSFFSYFFLIMPMALGSGLINPSLSALISKEAKQGQQGATLGLSQGLGSLARALGPFLGLLAFQVRPELPYWIAGSVTLLIFLASFFKKVKNYNLGSFRP